MADPVWEDPPPTATGGGRRAVIDPELLATLRKNPNKWARLERSWKTRNAAKSYGNSVRGGYNGSWGNNGDSKNWEFKCDRHPEVEGEFALWVQWTGPKLTAGGKNR